MQAPIPSSPLSGKVRPGSVQSLIQDIFSWKASEFPEELTKGLDPRYAFSLILRYKEKGAIQEKEVQLEILGREGYSDYVLRMPDQSLRKISSVYLEDILDPLKNFIESPKKELPKTEEELATDKHGFTQIIFYRRK